MLAIKRFQKTENIDAASASTHFNHELEFLTKLSCEKASHRHVLLDLGSITESDGEGGHTHDLFFPLAERNLREFLTGEKLQDHFCNRLTWHDKAGVFRNAVDVLGALSFLHHYNYNHLDIKPDNILVFKNPNNSAKLSWKLADFNFSHNQGPQPASLRELSKGLKPSQASFTTQRRLSGNLLPKTEAFAASFGGNFPSMPSTTPAVAHPNPCTATEYLPEPRYH